MVVLLLRPRAVGASGRVGGRGRGGARARALGPARVSEVLSPSVAAMVFGQDRCALRPIVPRVLLRGPCWRAQEPRGCVGRTAAPAVQSKLVARLHEAGAPLQARGDRRSNEHPPRQSVCPCRCVQRVSLHRFGAAVAAKFTRGSTSRSAAATTNLMYVMAALALGRAEQPVCVRAQCDARRHRATSRSSRPKATLEWNSLQATGALLAVKFRSQMLEAGTITRWRTRWRRTCTRK